jgi:hypothetical protein
VNQVADTSPYIPGQQDPTGWPTGIYRSTWPAGADPTRYVVWVDPGRTPTTDHVGRRRLAEMAPRTALHVACRNGAGS